MQKYSELERKIVQAIVAHISKREEISLTDLANECHVAKSTVSRALQKMGYRGMGELREGLRIESSSGRTPLLPRGVSKAGLESDAKRLAALLHRHRGHKNLVFNGDRRCADLLAAYFSRKLGMFDILAAATYDYAMTVPQGLEPGAAIFCLHRERPGRERLGQPKGYGEGMLAEARRLGFEIVVITDNPLASVAVGADLLIAIDPNEDPRVDLYLPRVLMLFETALSELSDVRGGRQ